MSTRSGSRPGTLRSEIHRRSTIARSSSATPLRVIGPESNPLATSTLRTDSMVPDVPMTTAPRACFLHVPTMGRSSSARVAPRIRDSHSPTTHLRRRRSVSVTQPRLMLALYCGAKLPPTQNSVLPPPMSMISRLLVAWRQRVRNAEKNQFRLFLAAEYSDRMSQQSRRGIEKRITILRIAQRRGADDGNPIERNGPQPLREARNAIEAPFDRRSAHRHHRPNRGRVEPFPSGARVRSVRRDRGAR